MAMMSTGTAAQRWSFAAIGALAGAGFAVVTHLERTDAIGDSVLALCLVFLTCGFGSFFALASEVSIRAAAWRALLHAVLVVGLLALALPRWTSIDGFFESAGPILALFALILLPMPFLIAQAKQGRWFDYPVLFAAAWATLMRGLVAVFFTVVVWLAIFLIAQVLAIVGLDILIDLVTDPNVAFIITGTAFGLAVGILLGLETDVSPHLLIVLLRLLLPVVTLGSLIFTLAALLRGFEKGLAGLSPAMLLLGMAFAGICLITWVVDSDEENAAATAFMRLSAQVMSVLLPVLALLSLYAVWQRIADQGLTPNRLLVLVLALIALAYGLAYSVALLRGKGWAVAVRAANPPLALLVVALAALWFTPVLNAEKLSAQSQLHALLDGRKSADKIDYHDFRSLGVAGQEAWTELERRARAEGRTDLIALFERVSAPQAAATEEEEEQQRQETLARLAEIMPLQPASATGTRDSLLPEMELPALQSLREACETRLDGGRAGCVMVVADLLPDLPGEEAVVIQAPPMRDGATYGSHEIYALTPAGGERSMRRQLRSSDGTYLSDMALSVLLREWQDAPPAVTPARLNQLGTGPKGLLIGP